MQGAIKAVCLLLVLGLMAIGCGKKSGLEGKVVDGKGNPIAGMKVIAKQVQPIKGYEQFEATTGADGKFSFNGLYPSVQYTIVPVLQDAFVSTFTVINSSPVGETSILPSPLKIRFIQTKNGVINDGETGLQWTPNVNLNVKIESPGDAAAYIKHINLNKSLGFSDWRLPIKEELNGLYDPSLDTLYKIDPMFQLDACCVLIDGPSSPGSWGQMEAFGFHNGKVLYPNPGNSDGQSLLAVRSPKSETAQKPSAEKNNNLSISTPLNNSVNSNRFIKSDKGIITDTQTNLQWLPDLGRKDISWINADGEVSESIAINRVDEFDQWRLPTGEELKTLYNQSLSFEYKIDSVFQLSACCAWTSERNTTSSALCVDFSDGSAHYEGIDDSSSRNKRFLAVRYLK